MAYLYSSFSVFIRVHLWLILYLLAAQAFLPVAFVNRQLERLMLRSRREAAIVRLTAVADHDILDPQIQQAIDRGRADQNGPRQPRFVEPIRHGRSQAGQDENGHAQAVRKILLLVQLMVAANGADRQGGIRGNVQQMIAVRALPFRLVRHFDTAGMFT